MQELCSLAPRPRRHSSTHVTPAAHSSCVVPYLLVRCLGECEADRGDHCLRVDLSHSRSVGRATWATDVSRYRGSQSRLQHASEGICTGVTLRCACI